VIHFLIAHVTVLLIVAFFILFAASKTEGLVALFGRILGIWVVLVAILHIVGFFAPGMMGMKGFSPGAMHDHWMHHWGQPEGAAPAATPAPAAPAAQPAAPAPKKP